MQRACSSKPSAWSIFRGKPSIRNLPRPSDQASPPLFSCKALSIAFCNSLIVTSIGTIVPSRIHVRIRSPYCEWSRFCSVRSRSPADQRIKWRPSGSCNPVTHQKGGKNQSLLPEERTAFPFLNKKKRFPFPRVTISLNNIPDPGPPRTKTTITFLLSKFAEGFICISCMLTTLEDGISVVICRGICGRYQ